MRMKRQVIETLRLRIYTTTEQEMRAWIAREPSAEMRQAYQEMLDGSLAHPCEWAWYAIWVIEEKAGALCVGDACFKGLQANGSVEIGYGIIPTFQGRGYATEAVEAMIRWAIQQPGVRCVEAETEEENHASKRVLAKCGFAPMGVWGKEGPRFVFRGENL